MDIKKLSKLEAVTILYNQILQELVVTEAKVKIATREEILDNTMSPTISENAKALRLQFAALQENIKIIEDMLTDEEKKTTETERN